MIILLTSAVKYEYAILSTSADIINSSGIIKKENNKIMIKAIAQCNFLKKSKTLLSLFFCRKIDFIY